MENTLLSGKEFLRLYSDRHSGQVWYKWSMTEPMAVARPRDMSGDDFDRLISIIGGDKTCSTAIAAYIARRSGTDKVSKLLRLAEKHTGRVHRGAMSAISRDRLITLSFAMGYTKAQTNDLLMAAGFDRLYPRDSRDAGIIFALNNGMDMDEWYEKIAPISDKYDPTAGHEPVEYVHQLRSFVESRRKSGSAHTLDMTARAGAKLDSLRGGADVFENWIKDCPVIIYGRERARFYLCRGLLEALDSQISQFEARKQDIYDCEGNYARTRAAGNLPPLIFGKPMDGGESLRFLTQTKAKYMALSRESFDAYRINYSALCQGLLMFYNGSDSKYADGELSPGYCARGTSPESLQKIISGQADPGRSSLMRLLLYFDSLSGCRMSRARLDGMLWACGYSGPDMQNVDDRFLIEMMAHRSRQQRQSFVADFTDGLYELMDVPGGFAYPSFRLLENVSRIYPELFTE